MVSVQVQMWLVTSFLKIKSEALNFIFYLFVFLNLINFSVWLHANKPIICYRDNKLNQSLVWCLIMHPCHEIHPINFY